MRRLALLLVLPATASALDHDELVDGPLSGDGANPTFVGVLELGDNTLSGDVDPGASHASFVVPAGMRVAGATVEIDQYTSLGQYGYVRLSEQGPFYWLEDVPFTAGGTQTFTSASLPLLGAGLYGFSAASVGPFGATYTFEATLTVTYQDLQLTEVVPLAAGRRGAILVEHGLEDERIALLASPTAGVTVVPGCGLAVPLGAPTLALLGVRRADASGRARFPVSVPSGFSGVTVGVVAVGLESCRRTTVATLTL